MLLNNLITLDFISRGAKKSHDSNEAIEQNWIKSIQASVPMGYVMGKK